MGMRTRVEQPASEDAAVRHGEEPLATFEARSGEFGESDERGALCAEPAEQFATEQTRLIDEL